MIDATTSEIQHLAVALHHEHDITLARCQPPPLLKTTLCVADLGYQGLVLEGGSVVVPFKKPKARSLEPEEKAFNHRLAQIRVKVEHRIRALKTFRLLKGIYRGRRRRFELRLRLIAGLLNHQLLNN